MSREEKKILAAMVYPLMFRIALAQLNSCVGAVEGNLKKAREARNLAAKQGADLVVYSELFLSGYPARDLILRPSFLDACEKALYEFAAETADGGPAFLLGVPLRRFGKIYNSVVLCDSGKIIGECFKSDLPHYDEFNEKRIFSSSPKKPEPFTFRGVRLGVLVCEDIWGDYDLCSHLQEQGAEILIVINGSPFSAGKAKKRYEVASKQVLKTKMPLIYVNQVGGQDELVFDGASFSLSGDGSCAFQMPDFCESIFVSSWQRENKSLVCLSPNLKETISEGEEAKYRACMLGLRDYAIKNGFKSVVLGLSGGIDSALCAAMAVDSFGPHNVHTFMMPSVYTSQASLNDARQCARFLGCHYKEVPISESVETIKKSLDVLKQDSKKELSSLVEENLQSRIRGVFLMAVSNQQNSLLLATGNKSEIATGYTTLYGDMNGGFNPLKDLYKTEIFLLASWRNRHFPPDALGAKGKNIPLSILKKEPSAELRPNQKDQDSLPPYPILDEILACLIEKEMSVEELIAKGHDRSIVKQVCLLVRSSEYKRRQAPLGPKLSKKSFNQDRDYPITNCFHEGG